MERNIPSLIPIKEIQLASDEIKDLVKHTPLIYMPNHSKKYQSSIYFKREDLQTVRSYKIRGAFNKIKHLVSSNKETTVVCASAGNHAQGVAQVCSYLKVKGYIFMPSTTPMQKIKQVQMFGGEFVEVQLQGDTFDDCYAIAIDFCDKNKFEFVHPFDDYKIIQGQATIGLEILQDFSKPIDFIFVPVGGGGLVTGLLNVFKELSPSTKIIGVEPEGAPSLKVSLAKGINTKLDHIDKFVDGAAVKKMGETTFSYCNAFIDDVITVPEGQICSTLLRLYNEKAIVVEPAGALSVSALEIYKEKIKDKTVVSIISGGNNDITRMEEIKERALLHEGLKHYFMVPFPQRAGALREFVVEVLGPDDDITHFEYTKKNSRAKGAAIVGIELKYKEDFEPLKKRMKKHGFLGEYLNENPQLFNYLI